MASGCGNQSDTGGAQISVDGEALTSEVMKVTVTISAPDMIAMTTQLSKDQNGNHWVGHLDGIPRGTDRTFKAEAYDSTNIVSYAGSVDSVTVDGRSTTVVVINLQQMNPPQGPQINLPVVSGISFSTDHALPGATVTLSVTAADPNTTDTISYLWEASCIPAGPDPYPNGAFSATESTNPTWIAPAYADDAAGVCTLSITVSEGGDSVKTFFTIQVSADGGPVYVSNVTPLIDTLKAALVYDPQGGVQTWDFRISTSDDPVGYDLGYEWSSPNCNTGDASWNLNAPYTVTAPHFTYTNSTVDCNFKVIVTNLCEAKNSRDATLGSVGALSEGPSCCGQAIGVIYGYLPAVAHVLP